ncbi:hypothetical protein E3T40_11590 [Cryobacterium sp. TMT1-19]|uniref:hypothetical protein n=1 Tax=unclassified Cryobacterium TaxID=2649013 RepID=UPI000CE4C198|nr:MULTISPECIES: hypothetical protein [unclassified Cryobacterium]TFD33686.1 hypothetical protein E3T40_11590 [Cryobacterium sp. TMT1-19]
MSTALYGLALLACPVAMGSMMWFMMRGKKTADAPKSLSAADEMELTTLRAEVDTLHLPN